MKTILFLLLSFACHAQMCEQWEHLKLRNPCHLLMICIPEIHETDSTILRITPNCNELHVKCDKCGVWITFGDPETIETFYKPVKGVKFTKYQIDNLLGVVIDKATLSINGISDTFDYDKGKEGITLSSKTQPKFESGNTLTVEARLMPIDSIEADLYATYPSTWTIDQSYYDTTKIVMLVSDTTDVYPTQHQIHENHFITIKPTSPNWMYGYLVTELSEKPGTHNVIFPEHPMRLIFLDLSKNPISKEIIIWDWKKVE